MTGLYIDDYSLRILNKFKLKKYTELEDVRFNIVLNNDMNTDDITTCTIVANNYFDKFLKPQLPKFNIQKAIYLLDVTYNIVKAVISKGCYDNLSKNEVFSLLIVCDFKFKSLLTDIEIKASPENEPLTVTINSLLDSNSKNPNEWLDYYSRLYDELYNRLSTQAYINITDLFKNFLRCSL